jgi:hypothetical protein
MVGPEAFGGRISRESHRVVTRPWHWSGRVATVSLPTGIEGFETVYWRKPPKRVVMTGVSRVFLPLLILIALLVIGHLDRTRHRVWGRMAAAAVLIYSLASLYALFY